MRTRYCVLTARCLCAVATAIVMAGVAKAEFQILWYTSDCGGGTSASSVYSLSGTVGQGDAAIMINAGLVMEGGFWAGVNTAATCEPCDTDCNGTVNPFDIQPFVDLLSPDPPTPCSTCAGDANQNGTVNPFDIQGFLDCLIP